MFLIANLDNRALKTLRNAGLVSLIGYDHFFDRLHDAVLAARSGRLSVHLPPGGAADEQIVDRLFNAIRQRACASKPADADGGAAAAVPTSEDERLSPNVVVVDSALPADEQPVSAPATPGLMSPSRPLIASSQLPDVSVRSCFFFPCCLSKWCF